MITQSPLASGFIAGILQGMTKAEILEALLGLALKALAEPSPDIGKAKRAINRALETTAAV
jgi:hypothetical protein